MLRTYLETAEDVMCFGCYACKQVCPIDCIEYKNSFNKFWYPVIDNERCIDCGLCKQVCPYENTKALQNSNEQQKVYAARSKDASVVKQSTSGGIFTELSVPVIEDGGVVFGVVMAQNFEVSHVAAKTAQQVQEMRGSKYVQSKIKSTYKDADNFLKNGEKVLFSGTPCQIAGLRKYLRKDYDNLITVDLICHGVLSPDVVKYHIKNLEMEYNSKAINVKFRDKKQGWKKSCAFSIEFKNGKKYYKLGKEDRFYSMFLSNYDLRECCYDCPFTSQSRVGDITLGDFWRIEETKPHLFDDKGHSMVLVNTEKGKKYFEKISSRLFCEEAKIEDSSQPKLQHPTEPDIWRKYYLRSVRKHGFEQTINNYFQPRPLWKKGIRYIQRYIRSRIKSLGL